MKINKLVSEILSEILSEKYDCKVVIDFETRQKADTTATNTVSEMAS